MRMLRSRVIGAGLLVVALTATACGDSGDDDAPQDGSTTAASQDVPDETVAPDGPDIVIGAQDFGESAILGEIYLGALTSGGFTASIQPLGGFRDLVIAGFEGGDINLTPEYAASMLEFLNEFAGEATGDAQETTDLLNARLEEIGLVALQPSEAIDTNAFVVTPETSELLGITTLSELAANGADLTLGGPPDCETNPFCIPGLESAYGLDMTASFQPLDAGQVTVQALDAGQIDVAILFSTSGVIADRGWVLLEDDQSMLAADNVVPVLTTELRDAYEGTLTDVLDDVSSKLTTADLTELNRRYDIDNEDADDIAADWLAENGY